MIGAGVMLAGRYRLERHIASGGMGDVWQGFDEVLGRTVAVKCLRAQPDEPSFIDRFRAEARTMATISHPGVVEVYDFDHDPAVGVYLVMRYIEGESLAHALGHDRRLSSRETLRLIAEAAEALHAAHEKGVIHRDVKPGNLLLRRDGSTVLTDFGIARSEGAIGHTSTGSLLGTAGYIAPERANGQPATARSDIYSLGVVAYRCLAGRAPFVGDSVVQLALRHAHDEPPPLPPDVPRSLRAIVERAMAKDPADRWPSGAALAVEARRALGSAPTQRQTGMTAPIGPPAPTARRRRSLLVALPAALVVLIIAGVAAFLGLGRDTPRQGPAEGPGATDVVVDAGVASPTADPGLTSPSADPSTPGATAGAGTAAPTAGTGAVGAPAPPTGLTATPVSPTAIRLQWTDNSSNESGFTVLNGSVSREAGADETTYDWTGLAPDTYMCFKVRAHNASGPSPYFPESDWVCVTTLPGTGPAMPTNLTATPMGPGTIRLQWTDNSSDETGFTVQNGVTSRNVGANTTLYDWTGLAPGTYMCFKVRSFHASGVSSYFPTAQPDWVCTQTPAA